MRYKCPGCGLVIKMQPEQFPLRCRCGHVAQDGADSAELTEAELRRGTEPRPAPPRVPRPKGAGDYLKEILAAKGARSHAGCGCESMARKMNMWGPQVCRVHRGEIIEQLRKAAKELGWWESVEIGNALMHEPWFRLTDRFGSLVDEAIRRAEISLAI